MSSRPLRTNAGTPVMASSMRCTLGRTRCCVRRRLRGADVCAARARSKRCARSARDRGRVAAFEADVVVDTDPGEERDFFPAKPWNAAVVAVPLQTRLLRHDPG